MPENNILTQEEMDALLKAVDAGEVPVKREKVSPTKTCTDYDFKNPSYISREGLRMLRLLHDNFSRNLGISLSAFLRTLVQVKVVSLKQIPYYDFVASLHNPTFLSVINMSPLKGGIIIELNTGLLLLFIERMLGGEGEVPSEVRPLTDIELVISSRLIKKTVDEYKSAWRDIISFEPKIEEVQTNPRFVQFVGRNENIVHICLELKLGATTGTLNICFPLFTLEPIISRLVTQCRIPDSNTTKQISKVTKIQDALLDVPVTMRAVLGTTKLSIREIIGLKQGDIIKLNRLANDEIKIKLDNKEFCSAVMGSIKKKKIAIVESIPIVRIE